MSQGLDLQDFFGDHHLSSETVESVEELRAVLREYSSAKVLSESSGARMKEAKARIQELFTELPEEIKATQALAPKDVAGQTFARNKKVITIDGWNIIVNEKVNTTFEREKFSKWLDGQILAAAPAEREAYREVKTHIDRMLDPKIGTELKIEPVKEG